MSKTEKNPKLKQLENFLINPDSEESKNYISSLLAGKLKRPEEAFVNEFLSKEFWNELGYSREETNFEAPAGVTGRVEWSLEFENKKIAIECKKPYLIKNGREVKHNLDGNDIHELEDQISRYLLSHYYIIFTNGFHWYFYSRESYAAWLSGRKKKGNKLTPYFKHLTAEEIFSIESPNHILNFLSRKNILESISSMQNKSIRHIISDDFFKDLKSWVGFIDYAFTGAPAKIKARTTALINKLIFVRTMEAAGIIPNNFLSSIWAIKKQMSKSVVGFVDQIDEELSDIYDTELFPPRYLEDENGKIIMENGSRKDNPARQKNYAYKIIPGDFVSAILKQPEELNLKDTGYSKVSFNNKSFYIRSLYWWKFETISADILGKAYETYLAEQRKKLGIYYTPTDFTEYLTQKTIYTIFDEKIFKLKSELNKNNWEIDKIKLIIAEIKDIKICDPSCGSGSFLIQAMRAVWKKYSELDEIIKLADKKLEDGQAVRDDQYIEKNGLIRFLTLFFRINDIQQRMGVMILRHIYGNDKDIKAVDTAKLNIWLECLRLDPNSFRRDSLKDKRHVLPNLEFNITKGDSLIGLTIEEADNVISKMRDSIKAIHNFKEQYVESAEKIGIVDAGINLRKGLTGFADYEFIDKLGLKTTQHILEMLIPTHWSIQHSDVFYDENGNLKPEDQRGFDVIIGNPPWEILKPNINEFFGSYHNSENETKFSLLKKHEKNKFIENALQNDYIKINYDYYQKQINLQRDYFKKSKVYRYQTADTDAPQNVIDINLYKLFLEKYYSILKVGGYAGIVIPSGFYTDLGSKGLRQLIFNKTKILSLFGFENRKGIFEEIHRQFKFITLVFKKGDVTKKFRSTFYEWYAHKISQLDKTGLVYDLDLIKKTSPDTISLLECKNQLEIDIIEKMFKQPLLAEASDWKIRFQREFHMTGDSYLFNVEGAGRILYEGKMVHQFTHKFGEPRYWIEEDRGKTALIEAQKSRVLREMKKNSKKINEKDLPELWIDSEFYRLCWRDVTNATNERTIICTILPPGVFLGQTLSYLRPNFFDGKKFRQALPLAETLFLCGLFNSFVVDFVIRHRISSHATMSQVLELPIPRLNEKDKYFSDIVERVGSLICTTKDFDKLKNELKIKNVAMDEYERNKIISQINAFAAKIYNIDHGELEYILNTFPLVDDDIKSRVLLEYDKLN